MIEIHHARGWEIEAAKSLWTDTFGDEAAYQEEFCRLCAPEGPLVLTRDGELCSMLTLTELALVLADGGRLRAGYIYALATRPIHRGQGLASMLIDAAAGLAASRGWDCLLTVPARSSLLGFFAMCGFRGCLRYWQEVFSPAAGRVKRVSPKEYAALREGLLAGMVHTAYTVDQLAFQAGLCPHPNSGLFRLELAHGPGCAAVENWPDAPVVKELLCAPGDIKQGGGACAALCGRPVQVRYPLAGGLAFAAIRWMKGTPPVCGAAPEGWMGLAFD